MAERDAQQARQLAEERRQREAAAAGQGLAGIKATPTAVKASAPMHKAEGDGKPAASDGETSPPMRVATPSPASK